MNDLVIQHPQIVSEMAKMGQILSQNKPQDKGVIASQKENANKLGKLLIDISKAIKDKKIPKEIGISGPVEVAKPKWYKPFELSWAPVEKLLESIKKHTFSVRVENPQSSEVKTIDEDALAKKIGKEILKSLSGIRNNMVGVDTAPRREVEVRAVGQRIADAQRPMIGDADDVARVGLVGKRAILREKELRRVQADGFSGAHLLDLHAARELARAQPHEGDAVAVVRDPCWPGS